MLEAKADNRSSIRHRPKRVLLLSAIHERPVGFMMVLPERVGYFFFIADPTAIRGFQV